MIIYFTADEHLYLRTRDVPSDWLLDRFKAFLYHDVGHYDVRIHGGDFFDTMPSLKELSVFIEYANSVTKPTYIIDGNHEATKRHATFLTELKSMIRNPLFHIVDSYQSTAFCDFLPYCELKKFAKSPDQYEPRNRMLITHVRGALPPHVEPEVDLSLFSKWPAVYCGDLHDYKLSQLNLNYPGSPLSGSRIRAIPRNTHGGFLIDLSGNDILHTWVSFDDVFGHLMRLPISEAGKYDEQLHNIVYTEEVASAKDEVSNLESGAKVEKVVKAKEKFTSLGLQVGASFKDTIQAYLRKSGMSEAEAQQVMAVIKDYNGLNY